MKILIRNSILWLIAFAMLIVVVILWVEIAGAPPAEAQPESQSELDLRRKSIFMDLNEASQIMQGYVSTNPEDDVRAYWKKRLAQLHVLERCGVSLGEGIEIEINRSFFGIARNTIVDNQFMMVNAGGLTEPYQWASRKRKERVFDPAADAVQLNRSVSRLSLWGRLKLWFLLKHTNIFRPPEKQDYSIEYTDPAGVLIVVCHAGLRYVYIRTAYDRNEWALRQLMSIVGAD